MFTSDIVDGLFVVFFFFHSQPKTHKKIFFHQFYILKIKPVSLNSAMCHNLKYPKMTMHFCFIVFSVWDFDKLALCIWIYATEINDHFHVALLIKIS